MSYSYSEKKAVAVLSSSIETGVALNVVGHLSISLGANSYNEIMGRNVLEDKSGVQHKGISKYPLIITKVKPSRLKRLISDVKQTNLLMIDYPKEMLETGHDDELAEALKCKENDELEYLGVLLYGDAEEINALTGKFTLYR